MLLGMKGVHTGGSGPSFFAPLNPPRKRQQKPLFLLWGEAQKAGVFQGCAAQRRYHLGLPGTTECGTRTLCVPVTLHRHRDKSYSDWGESQGPRPRWLAG